MHPHEEAIQFLLEQVKRHGDGEAQEKAGYLLKRISDERPVAGESLAGIAAEPPDQKG